VNLGLWGILFVSARLQMLNAGDRGLLPVLSGLCSGVKSDGAMTDAWTFLSKSTIQVTIDGNLSISQTKILREYLSNAPDHE
jgi:hypothetical protein